MQLDQLKEDAEIKLNRLENLLNLDISDHRDEIAKAIVSAAVAQMMVELHFDFGAMK